MVRAMLKAPPPAGVDVHQEWHLRGSRDAFGIDEHVIHGSHAEIRQAIGGVRHPGAGEIEGLEAAALGHQRHVGIDGTDNLQRLFVGQGRAKTLAGRGGEVGHGDSFHGVRVCCMCRVNGIISHYVYVNVNHA